MMDRRSALTIFGKSLAACAGWLSSRSAQASIFTATPSAAPATTPDAFEAQLQADMTRLGTRVYSEEGIAMLLACEDLTAKVPVVPASKAMNAALAPAFHRYTEGWQHLHPDAPVGDVAKLVELLAYRDFAGGGKDNNL